MEWTSEFWIWAWERHQNILSWYIRPLFLIPFIYFAYRRSLLGIVGTLLALATSMFWFPAPAAPDPRVAEFLRMEQEYLLGAWTPWKALIGALVPVSLAALALAFWRRSFAWGLAVLNAIALTKTLWSLVFGGTEGGMAVLVPAVVGLLICDLVVVAAWRRLRGRAAAAAT